MSGYLSAMWLFFLQTGLGLRLLPYHKHSIFPCPLSEFWQRESSIIAPSTTQDTHQEARGVHALLLHYNVIGCTTLNISRLQKAWLPMKICLANYYDNGRSSWWVRGITQFQLGWLWWFCTPHCCLPVLRWPGRELLFSSTISCPFWK